MRPIAAIAPPSKLYGGDGAAVGVRLIGASDAAWIHVDAAWAGPLVLSEQHKGRLAGIERADSVAVSAHKWLFQPKEAGLVFFRQVYNIIISRDII